MTVLAERSRATRSRTAVVPTAPRPSRVVAVGTIEDLRAFGREISKDKATAVAFLKQAGILDSTGDYAKPYRA
jgi:hypothetical protein